MIKLHSWVYGAILRRSQYSSNSWLCTLLKTSGKGLILGGGVDLGMLQNAQVKHCLMMSNAQKKLKKGKSHFEVCDNK